MSLAINSNELINGNSIEWERLEFKKGWIDSIISSNSSMEVDSITEFLNKKHNEINYKLSMIDKSILQIKKSVQK